MKTIVTTFALMLAWCAAGEASAQTGSSVQPIDSMLLSEQVSGDYLVRLYAVEDRGDTDYTVRYQINRAALNAGLDDNSRQLDEMKAFLDQLAADTLKRVESIIITGYASPDGPEAFNRSLASRRASDFEAYADRKYRLSDQYDVRLRYIAEKWEACRDLVAASRIPDRAAVLGIIDSSRSQAQKEQALKQLPGVWDFMRQEILPPLRRVEVEIAYKAINVVEELIPILQPVQEPASEPTPAPRSQARSEANCEPCPYEVVDETITGIIVEMPEESRREMRKTMREERREESGMRRELTEEERQLRQRAEHDAREARRIERRSARTAEKIAREEARAARQAEKTARKNMEDLNKM